MEQKGSRFKVKIQKVRKSGMFQDLIFVYVCIFCNILYCIVKYFLLSMEVDMIS